MVVKGPGKLGAEENAFTSKRATFPLPGAPAVEGSPSIAGNRKTPPFVSSAGAEARLSIVACSSLGLPGVDARGRIIHVRAAIERNTQLLCLGLWMSFTRVYLLQRAHLLPLFWGSGFLGLVPFLNGQGPPFIA